MRAALDLAAFVRALQSVDATGGPKHNRGRPLRFADAAVRKAIAALRGEVDARAVTEAWDRALAAPDYDGPPVWFHGDLAYLNLLAADGKLTGVIDWGTCGVGDPAIETIIAWSFFPPDARRAYRDALGIDDAMWERGKGWALTGVDRYPVLPRHEPDTRRRQDSRDRRRSGGPERMRRGALDILSHIH